MTLPLAALTQAREALNALARLHFDPRSRPQISEIWAHYLRYHAQRNMTPSGQDQVRYSWNNLIEHFEEMHAHEICQGDIDAYEDARREGLIGKPSGSATIRRELAYLMAAINFAARRGALISKDDVPEVELPANAPPREKWLSVEDIQRLLDAAASMRLRDGRLTRCERFIWLGIETAQRKTAILHLTWDRVDLEHRVIDFRERGVPTTNKRRGVVAISDTLRPVLLRALAERRSRYVLDGPADDVWHTMQLAGTKAGLGGEPTPRGACAKSAGVSPHMLRHSAATWMARNGVPLFHVAGVLANSVQITERVYAHHTPPEPARAVNQISQGRLSLRD